MVWIHAKNGCSTPIKHNNKFVLIEASGEWTTHATYTFPDLEEFNGIIEYDKYFLVKGDGFKEEWFRKKCQIG